jgi:nitroreductase
MHFDDLINQRFSVRAYKNTPLTESTLQRILGAANNAPSAGNLQAYEIIVVRDAERKQQLVKASWDQSFISQAPVALVFFANPDRNRGKYHERGADLYSVQDATIACAYAQLAATEAGLGTCWVGAFEDDAVRQAVAAPSSWRPVAILPIGVPAATAGQRTRRALTDLVHERLAES